jgi:hypothetical protein
MILSSQAESDRQKLFVSERSTYEDAVANLHAVWNVQVLLQLPPNDGLHAWLRHQLGPSQQHGTNTHRPTIVFDRRHSAPMHTSMHSGCGEGPMPSVLGNDHTYAAFLKGQQRQ